MSTNETLAANISRTNLNITAATAVLETAGGSLGNLVSDVHGLKDINSQLLAKLNEQTVTPETIALSEQSTALSEKLDTALTTFVTDLKVAAEIHPDAPAETPETPETPAEDTGVATSPAPPTEPEEQTEV